MFEQKHPDQRTPHFCVRDINQSGEDGKMKHQGLSCSCGHLAKPTGRAMTPNDVLEILTVEFIIWRLLFNLELRANQELM